MAKAYSRKGPESPAFYVIGGLIQPPSAARPDWRRVHIEVLDAQERSVDAQRERWAIFEQGLDAEYLKAYLKRLPDFDGEDAEHRASTYVRSYPDFHQALAFLIDAC
jgi:hypothetical protein